MSQSLDAMAKPNLLNCYEKIGSLQVKLQHLQARFGFSDTTGVMHSAQIDLQQVQLHAVIHMAIYLNSLSLLLRGYFY